MPCAWLLGHSVLTHVGVRTDSHGVFIGSEVGIFNEVNFLSFLFLGLGEQLHLGIYLGFQVIHQPFQSDSFLVLLVHLVLESSLFLNIHIVVSLRQVLLLTHFGQVMAQNAEI